MSIRMKDIARELGVSVVTVSKALRDHPDISAETKERIRKLVKELHYQPNWAARSLVTGRSYTIGLVVPTLIHPFFAEASRAISTKVRPRGYNLVIASSEEDPKVEQQEIEHLLSRQVDAFIIASVQQSFFETHLQIRSRNVPYVLIDRKFDGLQTSYVGADDDSIGRLATEHLVECGCRRIAHIYGPAISTGTGRLRGYKRALEKHGLETMPEYLVVGRFSDTKAEASGYNAMRHLLGLKRRPDGVFCFNDPIAMGAMRAILDAGLRIPKDIAIVGAGNLEYDPLLRVPLSSVDQGTSLLGARAAKLALELIEADGNTQPRTIVLPCRVMARESSLKGKNSRTSVKRQRSNSRRPLKTGK